MLFRSTFEPVCIPGEPYPVCTHFNPENFRVYQPAGNCLACIDVVHFPSFGLHPFLESCVYNWMKGKIISPAIQYYPYHVTMMPLISGILWIALDSKSTVYSIMNLTTAKLANFITSNTSNDTFNY